jgi:exonuclease SbcD
MKLLHFADAHIDMANYGRQDPHSGLPLRVMDYLRSLDTIVETAISERVDLVLFAGDAYKDRTPAPTYQREWGKRIMRLARAGIPTLLLVGNHDLSPALGRAHALDAFETLDVPHVKVLDRPALLTPADLEGLPLYVIALPWVSRSAMVAHLGMSSADPAQVYAELEARLTSLVNGFLEQISDPALPVVLTAHASVQGAEYGHERAVMLGGDLVLSGGLVRHARLDYVALGHIHKPQDLNKGGYPPVVYPGSIERLDFGEIADEKGFIIADVQRGATTYERRRLPGLRPMFSKSVKLESVEGVTERLLAALPPQEELEGAIVRLVVEYPADLEKLIDEPALREHAGPAFEFHLVKHPQQAGRVRLPGDPATGSYTPLALLGLYWQTRRLAESEAAELEALAQEIVNEAEGGPEV